MSPERKIERGASVSRANDFAKYSIAAINDEDTRDRVAVRQVPFTQPGKPCVRYGPATALTLPFDNVLNVHFPRARERASASATHHRLRQSHVGR